MALHGTLWLAKHYASILICFLNWILIILIQVTTKLYSGWVDPIPDPILAEKFLGYSWESNPGSLGWQSDMLTTIPNRWSSFPMAVMKITVLWGQLN